ncbi:hypothetical protein [Pseudomonas veronii]
MSAVRPAQAPDACPAAASHRLAASSIDRSSSRKRADTTTATYAAQNVVWVIQMWTA